MWKKLLPLLLATFLQSCSPNPYAGLGLRIKEMPADSESLTVLQLSFERNNVNVVGPEISGTWVYLKYEDIPDGQKKILLLSRADKTYYATVIFNPNATGKDVFTVESVKGLAVNFPEEGMSYH